MDPEQLVVMEGFSLQDAMSALEVCRLVFKGQGYKCFLSLDR
jgi:hypothetical protein